jgi:hypothetical protein
MPYLVSVNQFGVAQPPIHEPMFQRENLRSPGSVGGDERSRGAVVQTSPDV